MLQKIAETRSSKMSGGDCVGFEVVESEFVQLAELDQTVATNVGAHCPTIAIVFEQMSK